MRNSYSIITIVNLKKNRREALNMKRTKTFARVERERERESYNISKKQS